MENVKNIMNELSKALKEAEQRHDLVDKTPTLEIVKERDNDISKNVESIIKKYKSDLSAIKITEQEKNIIKKYIDILEVAINQDMTMCKVIPQCRIKDVINLKSQLGGFFAREADINVLLKEGSDYYKNLYNGLRLDYKGSEFKENDKYMGMLIVRLPKFSLRTPLSPRIIYDKKVRGRRICIDNEEPYSGIGFIANERGLPEFYISINNENKLSRFPQEAFNARFKIIGHNANIIDFASYDAGDFECAPDDKFIVNEKYRDLAIRNGWI